MQIMLLRRTAPETIPVAELAKSFGRHGESPKVLATSARARQDLSAARLKTKRQIGLMWIAFGLFCSVAGCGTNKYEQEVIIEASAVKFAN